MGAGCPSPCCFPGQVAEGPGAAPASCGMQHALTVHRADLSMGGGALVSSWGSSLLSQRSWWVCARAQQCLHFPWPHGVLLLPF